LKVSDIAFEINIQALKKKWLIKKIRERTLKKTNLLVQAKKRLVYPLKKITGKSLQFLLLRTIPGGKIQGQVKRVPSFR
jgi:hypothetical protein